MSSNVFGEGGDAGVRKKALHGLCFCCTVLRVNSHRKKKRWGFKKLFPHQKAL